MIRITSTLLLVGLLGGCSTLGAGNGHYNKKGDSPWLINQDDKKIVSCVPLSKEHELALSLSQTMMAEGRLHAALANIEQLPNTLPEARLGKAKILRLLKRPEAEYLYDSVLDTCLVAQGYHGLAQLSVETNHNEQALEYLKKAVALSPVNDAMRNDLGVIYLNLGMYEEARFELLTAIELNESNKQAASNLLTLLIHQGKLDQAGKLVSRYQLSSQQYQQATQRAQLLKSVNTLTADTGGAATKVKPKAVVIVAPVPAANKPTVTKAVPEDEPSRLVQSVTASPQTPVYNSKAEAAPQRAASYAAAENPAVVSVKDMKPAAASVAGVQQIQSVNVRQIVPLNIKNGM